MGKMKDICTRHENCNVCLKFSTRICQYYDGMTKKLIFRPDKHSEQRV